MAGHWVSTLPLSLLWEKKTAFRHHKNYQGPTWSWASSDTAIGFEPFLARKDGPLSDCIVTSRVVEVRPKLLVDSSPHGAFEQGTSVVLEGRLLRNAFLPHTYYPEPVTVEGTDQQCSVRGAVKFGFGEFDDENIESRPWTLLELCTVSGPDTWKEVLGLVLDPVDGKKLTFRRTAMFRIMHTVEDLPGDYESGKVSMAWVRRELLRRNPFNGVSVARIELV